MASLKSILNMDVDYPGIGIKPEISIMRDYLALVESNIERIGSDYIDREEQKNNGITQEEYPYFYLIAEEEIPRIIRNPTFVSIYSLLESSISQLLEFGQKKEKRGLRFRDIGRGSLLVRANKYMENVLNYQFNFSNNQLTQLSEIYKVRNFIVHSNATLETMSNDLDKTLTRLDQKGYFNYTYMGQAGVTSLCISESFKFVETILLALMLYMENRYSASDT